MHNGLKQQKYVYEVNNEKLNKVISLRPFSFSEDARLLHGWMKEPHVAPFWQLDVSYSEFETYLVNSLNQDHRTHYVVCIDHEPISYIFSYRVMEETICKYYDSNDRDLGAHVLIGPREFLTCEFIEAMVSALVQFVFSTYELNRIVVEPDVRNRIVIPALKSCGFYIHKRIRLPQKLAYLMICNRPM